MLGLVNLFPIPALDGGNCLAHVIELGLRPDARPVAVDAAADELHESLLRHLTADARPALDVFTTLALARLASGGWDGVLDTDK